MLISRRCLLLLLLGASWSLAAAPTAPPPPQQYKVEIRYRIRAARNERVPQFRAMTRFLDSIGFQKDPGPENEAEDPDLVRMAGTIASANARRILVEPHVKAILLVPVGYELPAGAEQRVKVQLELIRAFRPDHERVLADDVLATLKPLDFQEAIGYDTRVHTRIVGTIPANQLHTLLTGPRPKAAGSAAPRTSTEEASATSLPQWPVVVVEVIPEPAGVSPPKETLLAPAIAPGQEHLVKIDRSLRALPDQAQPVRIEILMSRPPLDIEPSWRRALADAAPGSLVEGRLGSKVILLARPDQAGELARLSDVLTVRLPRPATIEAPAPAGANSSHAVETALQRLRNLPQQGRGVRLAVIDTDFRGYRQLLGKQLPSATRYVDITAQASPDIEPKPSATESGPTSRHQTGHGTLAALAAALAAPRAELTLIRVDPEAPYQLHSIARYISGERFVSDSLERRREEIGRDNERLEKQRTALLQERVKVLESFGQDQPTVQRREAYFKKQAEFESRERALRLREQRYLDLVRSLEDLRGIQVVASAVVWNDGYPVDDTSDLSRYFDDRPFRAALWFQSVDDTSGQTWAGLFRDIDGNSVMEFAPANTPLKSDRWTPELNFLGWQGIEGGPAAELPKTKLRISVQWREPHDPTFARAAGDPYRTPLANLRLLLLRQRDPSGTKLPGDDMDLVARSLGSPLRLESRASAATYEQTLEYAVDAPGRYALRVEGRVPNSIRPANEPILPAVETSWELHPRIFVQVLDGASRASGKAVFIDYATSLGGLGMPADAHQVVSVGAADSTGAPAPFTSGGPALDQELHAKPDVLVFDGLPPAAQEMAGSGVATAFAAGAAASALSSGISPRTALGMVGTLRSNPRSAAAGPHR